VPDPHPPSPLFPEGTIILSQEGQNPSGSGVLRLRNDSNQDRPILLSASDFKSITTKKFLNARTVFFGPKDTIGQLSLETTLPKNSSQNIRFEVSNVWEAGESDATLYNQGDVIGTIKVVKFHPTFNVQLVGSPNDKPELTFFKCKRQQLILHNDDAMTYKVEVTIAVNGYAHASELLTLGPHSSDIVELEPDDHWFTPAGFVRDETHEGTVKIAYRPEGTIEDPGLSVKVSPIKVHLSRLSTFWLDAFSYVFIFLLLLAGGICSLLLTNWVPNQRGRDKLKARLVQLADRMRGLSTRIDTKLQVSLRVARSRMNTEICSYWSGLSELPTVLVTVNQRTDALERVLELIEQIDRHLAAVEQYYAAGRSQTQLEVIKIQLCQAKELLSQIGPAQTDIDVAKKKIEDAKAMLAKVDLPDDVFVKGLKDRVNAFKGLQKTDSKKPLTKDDIADKYKDFADILIVQFQRLDSLVEAGKLKPEDSGWLDSAIIRIELIQEYLAESEKLDEANKNKLAHTTPSFFTLVQADSAISLRDAKQIIRYMRERLFPQDIQAAITKTDDAPKINMYPQVARQYSSMSFSVDFSRPELNSCAALDAFRCEWDFPHDRYPLKETGWQISHYFPEATKKNEKRTVKVSFTNLLTGEEFKNVHPKIEFEIVPESSLQSGDRNLVELVRLVIALFIALMGLLAGAREQLLKLDLIPAAIAVFFLGFGADTIKNLIAPREK
jgi:hypothetical protein